MLSHQLPKLWLYSWSRSKQNQLLTQLIPLLVWLGIRLVRVTASSFSRKLEVHSDQRQKVQLQWMWQAIVAARHHQGLVLGHLRKKTPDPFSDSCQHCILGPTVALGKREPDNRQGILVTKTFLMQRASGSTNEKARPSIKDNLITHELRKEVECFRILSRL